MGDIEIHTQSTDAWQKITTARIHFANAFVYSGPTLWTVSGEPKSTEVYRDGAVLRKSGLRISPEEFSGKIVLGTLPIFNDDWVGVVRSLAIFNQPLDERRIKLHYDTWRKHAAPEIDAADSCAALYLFDERHGNLVWNRCDRGNNLRIPEHYLILRPTTLDPVWRAFQWSKGFWMDAAINLFGFVPPGFALCALFSACGAGRPVSAAAITASRAFPSNSYKPTFLPATRACRI